MFKIIGIAMITVVLCLFIGKQSKDLATLLSIAACCGIVLYAAQYLNSVMVFIDELYILSDLNFDFITILLKAAGIGLITEIGTLICTDSGYSAIGKTIQIVGAFAILWVSLPLFSGVLDLLNDILGEV